MLSRLLACFALVTGLAAIGAPVEASEIEAMSCQIDASAEQSTTNSDDNQICDDEVTSSPARGPGESKRPNRRTKRPARPPVLYGIDRAYE